ncbi:MAG: ATP-binding protein [Fuerstiella sp.]|nr:ATP-binding protein [Fuerstiella sp.]
MMRNSSDFLQKMLRSSIRLSSDFQDSSSIWCSTDTTQIQQVILNITMNARDALSHGGEIFLTAKEHPAQSGFALLAISDNGTGMSQDVLHKLFDPFFTTKSRG